jgi:predicted ATPase
MNLEAVELSGRLGIPYLRAHATNFTATVCQLLRDVPGTRRLAEETLQLATECGFSVFRITAKIYLGWCDVQEGRVADGLAATRDALDEYRGSGQRISTSSYTLLLIEAYLANGDVTGANEALDAAFAFMKETGERIYEHELYRLKGECLLAGRASRGRKASAADCFERAIALAAERKALLFELRAALSLCRVRESARDRLASTVARFAAEDDCADLGAARAYLRAGDR